MKRLISMLIIVCLVITMIIPASAAENGEEPLVFAETITDEMISDLINIPMFITAIEKDTEFTDIQKEAISNIINDACLDMSYIYVGEQSGLLDSLLLPKNEYSINYLSYEQKQSILNLPIYAQTFTRIQEIIDGGTDIKYINIYSSNPDFLTGECSAMSTNGNANDTSYWESNCSSLGTYNGYKFLYSEVSVGVETSEVTPGNISGSLKWSEIAKKAVQAAADHYVKNEFYKVVKAASNSLSTVFSIYESPLAITYSASSGYVKAKVSGDLYMRTVYIRDDLNRISGYAYYTWGTTEKLSVALRVTAKYPYKKNASGTYEYRYPSYTFLTQNSNTPGYYGNTTFYSSVISLYRNTSGYFVHNESIDVNSIVMSLLN